MPRPLDLPEDELLPLLRAACQAGVFSEAFLRGLRSLAGEVAGESPATEPGDLSEMARLQTHFHSLIRARAGGLIRENAPDLPRLSGDVARRKSLRGTPLKQCTGASSTGGIGRVRVCAS
jgi:hypothetical protein